MSNTVTVEARTGADGYGKPTYGSPVTYQAHISRNRTLIRDFMGAQVESGQAVHLNTADPILPNARITLSTGDVGSTETVQIQPKVLSIARLNDQQGAHHTVIFM